MPDIWILQPLKLLMLTLSIFLSATSYSQTLRVGTTLWPGYEPLYLAEEIKAYQHDIRMINYSSTSEVLRAFSSHSIEAAALTLDEAVLLAESKIPVDIILILDISEGADVIMGRPELKNMQGLIGARIAVESSAVGAYTLTRALEIHNIDINKVTLINVENSSHKFAYINHKADAVVTYEPVRTQLLNEGAIELFNSKEIPGEIVDILVVHKGLLSTHRDALLDITQGWFKALKHIKDEPIDSYSFIASRLKISHKEVKESYVGLTLPSLNENKTLLSGNPAPLNKTLDRLTQHMLKNRLISADSFTNATINPSFLP
jgi:NitT/TauT family transport system substrate-binding protein